jgi:glycosyltransferase involved in cell wall biosynthesis
VLHRHRLGGRALFGAGAVLGRPRLERLIGTPVDVAWIPAPVPVALRVPFVLTVHDLSFEERPGDYTLYERLWHRAARPATLARVADRLTAVSAATADAMTVRWGIPRGRIVVVAPGISVVPATPAVAERPYFLFVGALEPRKAPGVLAEAFRRARGSGLDADLVVVGDGRLRSVFAGVEGVRILGSLPRAEIDALYAGALAVVMASWLEGYGLPPLEAAAQGTPAIVSDLPVFRETLGADGAVRVAPGDAAELASALARVAGDADLRAGVAAAAQARLAPLTWERAAAGLHTALSEAAGA